MTTVIEAVKNVLETLIDDEPEPPLNVGEVMNSWTYLAMVSEFMRAIEIALNTTTDQELRRSLIDCNEQSAAQSKQLTDFLLREGVPLPPASEAKPQSQPSAVPPGVKLTDDEIANAASIKTVAAIVHCATATSATVRNDVALMFMQFLAERIKYGAALKTLMRKRGWLKVPPAYAPPGSPNNPG